MSFKRGKKEGSASFFVYYGFGKLELLANYKQLVLQPNHYSAEDIAGLKAKGTSPLAYISLGEDFAKEARPWQRAARNTGWNTHYVQVGHPAWQKHLIAAATGYLAKGFEGLFLDTVEVVDVFPEDRDAILVLIASLRTVVGSRSLVANRGFSLLPELAQLVDAVLFEGFSTRWTADSYEALSVPDLEWTKHIVTQLKRAGLKVYALDYSSTPELSRFARKRAATFGLGTQVSNRDLTEI